MDKILNTKFEEEKVMSDEYKGIYDLDDKLWYVMQPLYEEGNKYLNGQLIMSLVDGEDNFYAFFNDKYYICKIKVNKYNLSMCECEKWRVIDKICWEMDWDSDLVKFILDDIEDWLHYL